MADTTKYVNWDGLTYYDSKIKQHINDQVVKLQADTPTKAEFNALAQEVSGLIVSDSNQDIYIANLREQAVSTKATLDVLTSKTHGHANKLESIEATQTAIQDVMVKRHELNDYAKIDEVDKKIAAAVNCATPDLSDYYDKGQVDNKVSTLRNEVVENTTNVTNIITSLDEVKAHAVEDHKLIEGLLSDIQNKSQEGHTHNLSDIIDYELSGYTRAEIDLMLSNKVDNLTYQVDKTNFVTTEQLESYVSDEELDILAETVSDLAGTLDQQANTLDELQAALTEQKGAVDALDASLDGKLDTTVYTQDKVNFASKDYVAAEIAKAQLNGEGSDIDLSGYVTKEELSNAIPDVSGFVTQQELADAIEDIEHPTTDLSNYYTKTEIDNKGYLTEHQSLDAYYTKNDIDNKGFLTEHQSLEGYATEQYVKDAIDEIDVPPVDLSNYYTKEEVENLIPDVSSFLTEVPDEYAKKTDIPDVSKFLTEIPSDYAKKTDIPDVSKFVTESDLSEALSSKSNNVLFIEDMRVTTPVGGFVVDESVKDLTIAQILTKLLGLTTYVPPVVPEEPTSLVEKLVASETPMYSINNNGELVESEFRLVDAAAEPTESGFYTITDDSGNILEGGYQDLQIDNDEMYYIVALPKEIDYNTMIKVQTYDSDEKVWVDAEIELTSDPDIVSSRCEEAGVNISHIDTQLYTVWVQEDICTGSIIRYQIIEEI